MIGPVPQCDVCVATDFCKVFMGIASFPSYKKKCNLMSVFRDCIELARIPNEYHRANLYNYVVDEENSVAYEALKEVADNIEDYVKEGKGINFYSPSTGVGKTYSACVLLNHFLYTKIRDRDYDLEESDALYISYTELISKLRDNRRIMWDEIEMIKNVPLLLLDDINVGTITDFAREQTFIIIDYRHTHNLSTITTSNVTMTALQDTKLLGARTVSRLLSNSVGIRFQGERDRRLPV